MTKPPFPILYEDNHVLVVIKPAMLPTMGVSDKPTLLSLAKEYIKEKYNKPGNVYLGIVSRLDAPVTGVLVLARTSKAAQRLTDQLKSRRVTKCYTALVSGYPSPANGQCVDWLRKHERHRKVLVVAPQSTGAKQAKLTYETLRRVGPDTLLNVELETGRKHQIRVQLAHLGHPIVGDRKYGSRSEFPEGIALHCRRLEFDHPVGKHRMEFTAPPPKSWGKLRR